MEKKSLIVFDMDGVLVDVTSSYRETVRRTARLFFGQSHGSEALPEPLFPLEDLAEVKRSGGLNNDWDLSFRIVSMLFTKVAGKGCEDILSDEPWDAYAAEALKWDVTPLADFLAMGPGALQQLNESTTPENDSLSPFYRGDVSDGNVIKQIFQEIYLGGVLFESTYGIPPRMYDGEGLIYRETPLVTSEVLSRLHQQFIMAVATGRPRSEAIFALEAHDFDSYFDFVLTLDDCLSEEGKREAESGSRPCLSKPDPFMLDATVAGLASQPENLYYLGDMPDDMVAAKRSRHPFMPVGVIGRGAGTAALGDALAGAGAEFLIEGVEDLEDILKTSPSELQAQGGRRRLRLCRISRRSC
jgi:HAD superfamily phosphatase